MSRASAGFRFGALLALIALAPAPAAAAPPPVTGPIQAVPASIPKPLNLRQPANAADCVAHVAGGGTGYYEHVAYGCSHPTAGYFYLIWDYSGPADGFHIYRVDGARQDYGVHKDGTVAQIQASGTCFVVTAVRGSN